MATEQPPLQIVLDRVSKRFGREWVLRQLTQQYQSGSIYGIEGRNGSGKSTLLRLLAGQLSPSRGSVTFTLGGRPLPVAEVYRCVSWTGPYLEVVEELTIEEALQFHFGLKPLAAQLTVAEVLDRIELGAFRRRTLRDCSSGMRQRILLATGLYAATPLLLLDEPTVTLDRTAADWFTRELSRYAAGRLVVIASNDARDLALCRSVQSL